MWSARYSRPAVGHTDIDEVLSRTYGLTMASCKQLSSYDDKNFHVLVEGRCQNPYVGEPDKNGYVLKICSDLGKENGRQRFEAQINMMLHARSKGFVCPEPIKTVDGRYYHVQAFQTADLTTADCVVRLCGFIDGDVLSQVPITAGLMREAGAYLGRLRRCLEDFTCTHLQTEDSKWSFSYIPKLKDLLPFVPDISDRLLAADVIDAWILVTSEVQATLPSEPIHGDFNPHNIIIRKGGEDNKSHICGVLDFGDATVGCYVHDLGILIMYMMTFGDEPVLNAGGHVLSGYLTEHTLAGAAAAERLLFHSVAARLVQSLLIGLQSYSETGDEFQLETQRPGWAVLRSLWAEQEDGTLAKWREVATSANPNGYTVV